MILSLAFGDHNDITFDHHLHNYYQLLIIVVDNKPDTVPS